MVNYGNVAVVQGTRSGPSPTTDPETIIPTRIMAFVTATTDLFYANVLDGAL
jgi:hypothetical protein